MENAETIDPVRLPPPAGARHRAQPAGDGRARGFMTHVLPPLVVIGLLLVDLADAGIAARRRAARAEPRSFRTPGT